MLSFIVWNQILSFTVLIIICLLQSEVMWEYQILLLVRYSVLYRIRFKSKVSGSSPQPFWHQALVWWKTVFLQTEGRGWWFQDDSRAVGFELLWEFNTVAYLTGCRPQAVMLVMGSSCKYRWSFAHLPALHTPPAVWPRGAGRVVGVPCYKEHFPNPGIEPVSSALASRFFTTAPPGNPLSKLVTLLILVLQKAWFLW